MNLVLKIIAAVCYYLGSKSWQEGQRKKSEDKEILVVDEDFENDSINFGPIEPRNTSRNTSRNKTVFTLSKEIPLYSHPTQL